MADIILKRLYIGGLNANISREHLQDRFKSFGRVESVEWPGPDALGQPRRFAYISLETTAEQYKKCLNIMSGSTWRGAQLRIAEAKPTYTTRLERERNPTPEESALRLRKRRRKILNVALGQNIGKEAQDMRMVTPENYQTHKFWTKTPDRTLLRSLALRPAHPLPVIPTASASSSKPRRAPTRARRRVINLALWNPSHQHLYPEQNFADLEPAEWSFEPEEDLQTDEDGYAVLGRWRANVHGEEISEVVRGKRRPDELEQHSEFDVEESEVASTTSDLFGTRRNDEDREPSPLFGNRPRHTDSHPSTPVLDDTLDPPRRSSSSPPAEDASYRSVDAFIHSSRHDRVESTPPPQTVELPDGVRAQIKQEQARDLSILDSILGGTAAGAGQPHSGKLWYEDSDSDTEEHSTNRTNTVLRLRGGAPDESDEEETESADESEESDTTSTGSEDSDESSGTTSNDPTTSDGSDTPAPPEAGPSKPQSALKDMFASKQVGGSLLAHLGDIEMDDSFDLPVPTVQPQQREEETEDVEMFQPSAKAKFVPDPSEPLFFPTVQPHQHAKSRDLFSADRENPQFQGFWAQETDAEMREIWERDKLGLTREWKRRHREAKKHRRRKGGLVDDMD